MKTPEREIPGAIVTLDGYLATDPVTRNTENNQVTDFPIYLNGSIVDGKTDEKGRPYRPSVAIKVTAWSNTKILDKTTDLSKLAQIYKKGNFVRCIGQLKPREYEGKIYWDINATELKSL